MRIEWVPAAAIGILLTFAVAEAQLRPMGVPVPKQPTASSTPCVPRRLSVKPIDELKEDASFRQFKRRLVDIAALRDAAALYRLLAPDFFEVGCCQGQGGPNYRGADAIAHFKNMIASNPYLWLPVQQVLEVGVVKTERTHDGYTSPSRPFFCGPATDSPSPSACDFDGAITDGDDMGFIIGSSVPLRAAPDSSAKAITALSWDMVQFLSHNAWWDAPNNWAKVRLGDGTVGYVDDRFVHWFLGPTLCFGKEVNGQWDFLGIDLGGD